MRIKNVIQTIDQNAREFPMRLCYEDGPHTYTYAELIAASDRIALYLRQQDLQENAPILIYGDQSFNMIASFLGCVKSGHAYIPVDVHSPEERLLQITAIAQPALALEVVPLPVSLGQLPVLRAETLQHLIQSDVPAAYGDAHWVGLDENYYIIFTSGTTGVPKGVQISHDNLLSYVNWMLTDFGLLTGVRALSQAPYSFDLSVMDLYPTLCLGGTVVALRKEITDQFKLLFAALPKLKVNLWVSTPSFADICLLDPQFDSDHYPELTHFCFCGEELTVRTAKTLLQRFPKAAVYNTYGPTEATVAVTGIRITPKMCQQYPRLPIGRAKADTRVYVGDSTDKSTTNTAAGELMIEGPSVSRGYLNNEAKTAKAFFKGTNGRGYRTGDLGFVDEQGLIFYRGRLDFQVKLHGYRIELEDIDQNLQQLHAVKQASTVPRYNPQHQVTQLIAYVVPEEKTADIAQLTRAIKAALSQQIMSYMVPQRFVFQEKLPLTANGKVDRKTLIAEVNHR